MIFSSYQFIFFFLPIAFAGYFILNNSRKTKLATLWLIASSLFFYGWWDWRYLPLLIVLVLINFYFGKLLTEQRFNPKTRKLIFTSGVALNLLVLGYFKYADFFISNANTLFDANIGFLNIILPLGISFFTFQKIAYLADCHAGKVKKHYTIEEFGLFVSFFPQLIAGPIVHHSEVMPQFNNNRNKVLNYRNIALGIFIFSIGLFKKLVIADGFSGWVEKGFDVTPELTLIDGWIASLSYTFQLYFDFSGYADMAIGAALLFNIRLPANFNSPYKASNIQNFWRAWHITLSKFLRDYIYIPLGGNKTHEWRVNFNLFITFLLGGLWHGANWTFVFWGFLHGFALIIHRLWSRSGFKMPYLLGWFITFNFVNIAWVFFRAKDWESAFKVLSAMFGFNGVTIPHFLNPYIGFLSEIGVTFAPLPAAYNIKYAIPALIFCLSIVMFTKNSVQMMEKFRPNITSCIYAAVLAVLSFTALNRVQEFLYFNF